MILQPIEHPRSGFYEPGFFQLGDEACIHKHFRLLVSFVPLRSNASLCSSTYKRQPLNRSTLAFWTLAGSKEATGCFFPHRSIHIAPFRFDIVAKRKGSKEADPILGLLGLEKRSGLAKIPMNMSTAFAEDGSEPGFLEIRIYLFMIADFKKLSQRVISLRKANGRAPRRALYLHPDARRNFDQPTGGRRRSSGSSL
jgi:hypothetical protein